MEQYGANHRRAKEERLERLPSQACEITGDTNKLENHHNQPKALDGPDLVGNAIILANHFHSYLHEICNVQDAELFALRKKYARAIYNNPLSQKVTENYNGLVAVDEQLMHQWALNLLTKFGGDAQMKVSVLTVVRNMETIRDQRIENHKLQTLLAEKDKEIEELKKGRAFKNPYTL